jgi:hypothetical protein
VLRARFELGDFDPAPLVGAYRQLNLSVADTHHSLAREVRVRGRRRMNRRGRLSIDRRGASGG